jgi:predicted nucleotidyltransferase
MVTSRIDFPVDQVIDFCKRWQVNEFSLFGSVLRDDFRPDSDVDVLVSFNPCRMICKKYSDARWTWLNAKGCAIHSVNAAS